MRTGWLIAAALAAGAGGAHARPVKVGDVAPDFRVRTFDGQEHSLADYRGKVLLMNHWATWCGPCKAELPLFENAYRLYARYGLEVLAVTTEDSLPRGALRRLDAAMTVPLANRMRSKGAYGPIGGAVPSTFLIDRAGRIRLVQAGAFDADSLAAAIGPLLNEKAP